MSNYKSIRQQFFHFLKMGRGEAYFILQDNPHINFSDLIKRVCSKHEVNDPQSEGSRAKYLFNLIKRVKNKIHRQGIIDYILEKVQKKQDDAHGLNQLCDLAVLLHKSGNSKARNALTQGVINNLHSNYIDDTGVEQIVEIDGLKGIIGNAQILGKKMQEDDEFTPTSWWIDNFQQKNKKIDVYQVIEQASENDPAIKTFNDWLIQNKEVPYKRKPGRKKRLRYQDLKVIIEREKFLFVSKERAASLREEENILLAKELIQERKPKRIELYLRFFSKRTFPLACHFLLKIAKSPNPRGSFIKEYAIKALSHFKNQAIRGFAIESIKKRRDKKLYLPLLINNYQEGDHLLVETVLKKSTNFDEAHDIQNVIKDIFKASPSLEAKDCLEQVYNYLNCGICRIDLLKTMYSCGTLTPEIITALPYDCGEGILQFYRKIQKD